MPVDTSNYGKFQGNLYFGYDNSGNNVDSSGHVASIGGTNVFSQNVVATHLNVTGNFITPILNVVDIVSENFTLNGFNNYEGNYAPGDIISYELKGVMPASVGNNYFTTLLGDLSGFAPDTSYDISFYEIVYWGADSRSNDTIRMSATVCVPSTILNNNTIVSYKHSELLSTYQNATLWNTMQNIVNTNVVGESWASGVVSWMLATTGYVTVCADNPGYGISNGFYNYADPYGETNSQYNALVALKQLIVKESTLFNTVYTTPINVISTGYSLGGNFCPIVSQLIRLNTTDFNLVNTIAGAPFNSYGLLNTALYDGSGSGGAISPLKTIPKIYLLTLLNANTSSVVNADKIGLNPAITTGVLPIFNQLYLNTPSNIGTNEYDFTSKILDVTQTVTGGSGVVDFSGNSWTDSSQGEQYVVTQAILSAPNNYLDIAKQSTFYTNIFVDYTDLSGTPINVIYSSEDELCCYNPTDPYLGSSGDDLVNVPFSYFVQTPLGLNRLGYYTPIGYTNASIVDVSNNIVINAGYLTSSENTQQCYGNIWSTSSIGYLGHSSFSLTVFQSVIREYLLTR